MSPIHPASIAKHQTKENRICDFISAYLTVRICLCEIHIVGARAPRHQRRATPTRHHTASPRRRARRDLNSHRHRHVSALRKPLKDIRHRAYTITLRHSSRVRAGRWPLPLREREAAATPHGALAPRPWMERVRCPSPTARMTARRACACLSRCSGVWAPAPSLTFARPHAAFRSNPLLADLCTMDLSPLH